MRDPWNQKNTGKEKGKQRVATALSTLFLKHYIMSPLGYLCGFPVPVSSSAASDKCIRLYTSLFVCILIFFPVFKAILPF